MVFYSGRVLAAEVSVSRLRVDYSGCRSRSTREVDQFSSSHPQFNFSERRDSTSLVAHLCKYAMGRIHSRSRRSRVSARRRLALYLVGLYLWSFIRGVSWPAACSEQVATSEGGQLGNYNVATSVGVLLSGPTVGSHHDRDSSFCDTPALSSEGHQGWRTAGFGRFRRAAVSCGLLQKK